MPTESERSPLPFPVLFVWHGSPLNAIEDNRWSRAFRALGTSLPRPRAVLAVSAHWYVPGTFVTADVEPRTIHDFSGFPEELYDVRYPAPGDPTLAAKVARLVDTSADALRTDWGLDHGAWSVLRWVFPAADVPVVQLSIDLRLPAARHVALGRALAPLRDEGILLLASGNLTHDLRDAFRRLRTGDESTPEGALRFDTELARALVARDLDAVAAAPTTPLGRAVHPTPDHYLPLCYAAGAADSGDRVSFPIEGFSLGSLSMRAVLWERVDA